MNPMKYAELILSISKATPGLSTLSIIPISHMYFYLCICFTFLLSDPITFLQQNRDSFSGTQKEMNKDAFLLITLGLTHQLLRANPPVPVASYSPLTASTETSVRLAGRELAEQYLKEVEPEMQGRFGTVDPSVQLSLEAQATDKVVALYHLCLAEKAQVCISFPFSLHCRLSVIIFLPLPATKRSDTLLPAHASVPLLLQHPHHPRL